MTRAETQRKRRRNRKSSGRGDFVGKLVRLGCFLSFFEINCVFLANAANAANAVIAKSFVVWYNWGMIERDKEGCWMIIFNHGSRE